MVRPVTPVTTNSFPLFELEESGSEDMECDFLFGSEPSIFEPLFEEVANVFNFRYSESDRKRFAENFYREVMDLLARKDITITCEDVKNICFYTLHVGSHTNTDERELLMQLYASGISKACLKENLQKIVPKSDYARWNVLEGYLHSLEIKGR